MSHIALFFAGLVLLGIGWLFAGAGGYDIKANGSTNVGNAIMLVAAVIIITGAAVVRYA